MGDSFVQDLPTAAPDEAAAIEAEARRARPMAADLTPAVEAARGLKPGSVIERWPVKTGQDHDVDKVGKRIVPTTITKLGAFSRPSGWELENANPPTALRTTRDAPAETTIWRIDAIVVGLRMEDDGDYHLELQDDGGAFMIAEIPLPKIQYLGKDNPFLGDIQAARKEIDKQFRNTVQALSFVRSDVVDKLVPRAAVVPAGAGVVGVEEVAAPDLAGITQNPDAVGIESFAIRVDPTPARITGIGFFDRSHGQAGNAANFIELHPVLKIEFA